MESFWDKALPVINNMIVDLSPFSYSVKRGVGVVDIRLEIQPEPNFTPPVKKKKPSPSRLRRNHRRMLLFLEKSKTFPPAELDNSGIIEVDTGTSQVCTGTSLIPGIQHGGPDIPAIELRENANIQENDDHTGEGDNSSEDNTSEGKEDNSSEDFSSEREVDDTSEDDSSEGEIDSVHKMEKMYTDFSVIIEGLKQWHEKWETSEFNENNVSETVTEVEGFPTGEEEPTGEEDPAPGSPDVESSTLPAMKVDNIDINVSDVLLPGTPSVKVSPKLVEESVKTRQFVRVARKGRRKRNLKDPNNCKAS